MKSFTKDFFLQREINNSRVLWHYSMHQYFFHKKPGTSSTIYPAYNFFALRQFEINCAYIWVLYNSKENFVLLPGKLMLNPI